MAESGMAVCYASSIKTMEKKIEQGSALCKALLADQMLLTGSGFSIVRDGECLRCRHFNDCLQVEKKLKNSGIKTK
ncbi:hypothetical protein [Eubacterium sp. 1001713B170207_170306_E7]|uniref:hypothetical protein n=1 Tax=Eubacterium sp. 1001713B170207_170306_E7 TaxID=2787097 RepID=UPI001898B9E2|nr:hypothetical protein [Eubacterium sp. 1001713B170207_170306_E7]